MKIVYLAQRLVRAQELVKALQDNGILCKIIASRDYIGVRRRFQPLKNGKKHRLFDLPKKIREYSPDLVISDTVARQGFVAALSMRSIPFCVRLRANFWDEVKQRKLEQKTLSDFSNHFVNEALGKFCLKISDAIFPVCNYLRNVILDHIPVPEKVFSVVNGVDTSRFNLAMDDSIFKQKYGLTNQKLIVCVSNLNFREKARGIAHFLPTIKGVLDAYSNITFVVVGGGLYSSYLEDTIKRHKLFPQIIMTGSVEDVEYAYAAADIIFYPTFHDSLPTVLLEASACGKPIIASKVGGIPEIILNKKTGLLFDPYDKKTLLDNFRTLLEDEQLKKQLGTNARTRIERHFSWSKVGKRLSRLLRSLSQN